LAGLGNLDEGVSMLERSERELRKGGRIWAHVLALYLLGALYAAAASSTGPVKMGLVLHNPRFFAVRAPRIDTIARRCLEEAAQAAEDIGALGTSGEAWLALAGLHQARGRAREALDCYDRAAGQFTLCSARYFLERVAVRRAAVSV
jgi:tetratricopeptide (TPR) repeat protein